MSGFKTSRVVVIDDVAEEALPVIEALGRLGIGSIYIPGERLEDLPKGPLRGVRLVILDMRLGTTGGEKQTAAMTANVFRRLISPDEGPLIVLLWTKHAEDIPAFQKALFDFEPKFRSTLLIADLEKPVKCTAGTMRKVLRKIEALSRQWSPMDFLWSWEQLAHNASTGTTAMLANHVGANAAIETTDDDEERKQKWLSALKRLLLNLAQAAAGSSAGPKTAKEDLLEALIAINSDRLEVEAAGMKPTDLSCIFNDVATGLTREQAAELNGLLLLGAASNTPQELRPGNAYVLDAESARRGRFKTCGIDLAGLASEILGQFTKDPAYNQLHKQVDQAKDDPDRLKQVERARDERKTQLTALCQPILLEITPSCDFAQRTRHVARLAAGMLVPVEIEKVIYGKKESLRPLEVVKVPGRDGLWRPVFSGRFVYTLKDPRKCLRTLPAFRVRTHVLADMRNWFASQSSRPGYLSIASRN